MAWGPDTLAGFTLAALLLDDRDFSRVSEAVPPELLAALRGPLDVLGGRQTTGSAFSAEAEPRASALAQGRESAVRALLGVLRPELTEAALSLPARMRGLLARLTPPPLRSQLRSNSLPTRPEFKPDEQLLSALSRIARAMQERETP